MLNITFNGYTVRDLTHEDVHPSMLDSYDRHQPIERTWQEIDGEWTLCEDAYIMQWSKERTEGMIANGFGKTLRDGGTAIGAYTPEGALVAFTIIPAQRLGSRGQYLQILQLQVSDGHRGKGLGKKLLALAAQRAKELGAEKLYISTMPAEDTQAFYKAFGCIDAEENLTDINERGPRDRQMEYIL